MNRLAIACLALLAAHAPVWSCETSAEVAAARAAADAAELRLVDQRLALWQQLSASQKAAFAGAERAWLNAGREEQVRRCAGPAPDALAFEQCRHAVAEQHAATLAAPLVASAAR